MCHTEAHPISDAQHVNVIVTTVDLRAVFHTTVASAIHVYLGYYLGYSMCPGSPVWVLLHVVYIEIAFV